MSKIKNGAFASKDAEEKDDSSLDKILDSSACRQLFSWARPKSDFDEADARLKDDQKKRWNFDFETETPLPGRYQWVKVEDSVNGNSKNGAANRTEIRNGRNSRQSLSSPYSRKTRSSRSGEAKSSNSPRSTGSCDTSLSGPRRSKRNSQVQLNDSSLS